VCVNPQIRGAGARHPFVHELRHAQATLLIGNGTDIKTVQHRLGHSTASLTMNIYAHAIAQNDRGAAEAISGILHKKTTGEANEETEGLEAFAHDQPMEQKKSLDTYPQVEAFFINERQRLSDIVSDYLPMICPLDMGLGWKISRLNPLLHAVSPEGYWHQREWSPRIPNLS
jgi:hypothetical protein